MLEKSNMLFAGVKHWCERPTVKIRLTVNTVNCLLFLSKFHEYFYRATHVHLSVCLHVMSSVASRFSIKAAKHIITQTMLRNSQGF